MKLNKFSQDEIFFNTIKANPKVTFTFVGGETFLNNVSSSNSNVPNGMISAYDLSVNRTGDDRIYQFLNKDSDFASWKTTSTTTYASALPGTEFKNYLALTSSVQVEFGTDLTHVTALKNIINYYYDMSLYFDYDTYIDNKEIKLISIPSVFYGSSLEKGATRLDFYYSGSLVATATDKNKNGELIQVSGSTTGGVVGLALYNEGFIVLFGTASLGATVIDSYTSGYTTGSWIDFADTGVGVLSSAFKLKFNGTTYTPNLTMFAHAGTGKYNFSNNPTFVLSGSKSNIITGSMLYAQTPATIKNITTSSFTNFDAPFKKTTFISKVAIYDENKRLLGVANLAEPIRKTEDLGYTFKIKLDL
jgi:hypothetical protein